MIKYHGTPLTPKSIFFPALKGRNVLIPFPRPDNQKDCELIADKIILDNGAFTMWTKGRKPDWDEFYRWVEKSKNDIHFISENTL